MTLIKEISGEALRVATAGAGYRAADVRGDEATARRRWASISEGWADIAHDCPVLYQVLRAWAQNQTLTFRWVADTYLTQRRKDLDSILSVDAAALKLFADLWPKWRPEAPNIQDSPSYERHEALRVCGAGCELMKQAMRTRARWEALFGQPQITVTADQWAKLQERKP